MFVTTMMYHVYISDTWSVFYPFLKILFIRREEEDHLDHNQLLLPLLMLRLNNILGSREANLSKTSSQKLGRHASCRVRSVREKKVGSAFFNFSRRATRDADRMEI